mgnify:CR=1 FL=1|tara:strand:- start:37 stop:423 length:387 start_codon:yes stop_codon:yes gene_type:complete
MRYTFADAFNKLVDSNAKWGFANGDKYENLIWMSGNSYPKPTEEEVNQKLKELQIAEPLRLLRIERNRRLAECDWIVTKNAEYGYNISKEWRTYRQALRDLPSITYKPELDVFGNLKMDSVAWPTPPE